MTAFVLFASTFSFSEEVAMQTCAVECRFKTTSSPPAPSAHQLPLEECIHDCSSLRSRTYAHLAPVFVPAVDPSSPRRQHQLSILPLLVSSGSFLCAAAPRLSSMLPCGMDHKLLRLLHSHRGSASFHDWAVALDVDLTVEAQFAQTGVPPAPRRAAKDVRHPAVRCKPAGGNTADTDEEDPFAEACVEEQEDEDDDPFADADVEDPFAGATPMRAWRGEKLLALLAEAEKNTNDKNPSPWQPDFAVGALLGPKFRQLQHLCLRFHFDNSRTNTPLFRRLPRDALLDSIPHDNGDLCSNGGFGEEEWSHPPILPGRSEPGGGEHFIVHNTARLHPALRWLRGSCVSASLSSLDLELPRSGAADDEAVADLCATLRELRALRFLRMAGWDSELRHIFRGALVDMRLQRIELRACCRVMPPLSGELFANLKQENCPSFPLASTLRALRLFDIYPSEASIEALGNFENMSWLEIHEEFMHRDSFCFLSALTCGGARHSPLVHLRVSTRTDHPLPREDSSSDAIARAFGCLRSLVFISRDALGEDCVSPVLLSAISRHCPLEILCLSGLHSSCFVGSDGVSCMRDLAGVATLRHLALRAATEVPRDDDVLDELAALASTQLISLTLPGLGRSGRNGNGILSLLLHRPTFSMTHLVSLDLTAKPGTVTEGLFLRVFHREVAKWTGSLRKLKVVVDSTSLSWNNLLFSTCIGKCTQLEEVLIERQFGNISLLAVQQEEDSGKTTAATAAANNDATTPVYDDKRSLIREGWSKLKRLRYLSLSNGSALEQKLDPALFSFACLSSAALAGVLAGCSESLRELHLDACVPVPPRAKQPNPWQPLLEAVSGLRAFSLQSHGKLSSFRESDLEALLRGNPRLESLQLTGLALQPKPLRAEVVMASLTKHRHLRGAIVFGAVGDFVELHRQYPLVPVRFLEQSRAPFGVCST